MFQTKKTLIFGKMLVRPAMLIILFGCGEMTGDSGGKITSAGSDMTGPTTTNMTTNGSGKYAGNGYATVYQLLGGVSYNSSGPYGTAYDTYKNGSCIRDKYVSAAIAYAWAADAYASQGNTQKASGAAAGMCTQLKDADNLCSSAPVVGGGGSCVTEQIYSCGTNGGPGTATSQGCP